MQTNDMQTYNPCDDCDYSYSKNNQEMSECKICEFKLYLKRCEQLEQELMKFKRMEN